MYTASYIDAVLPDWKVQATKPEIVQWLSEMCLDWQYVYASQGQDCTPSWRKSRIPYCPEQKYVDMIINNCPVLSSKHQPNCDGCAFIDTKVFDCAGFVLWLLTQAGVSFYGQGATTQWNTPSNWAVKGEIKDMPKDLVCIVYKWRTDKMSHTGISIGDGCGGVIHCSTTVKRGNAYTDFSPWTHWGIPKGLYSTEELRKAGFNVTNNISTLRKGMSGDAVKKMQLLLNKAGANLNPDGKFGALTESALKQFQKDNGLTADGICGPKTWAKLDQYDDGSLEPEPVVENKYELVWNKLYASIKNSFGVAGIMGNLQAESGIQADDLQNTGKRALGMTNSEYTKAVDDGVYSAEQFEKDGFGYGIAQWTYSTRKKSLLKYAKNSKKSVGDLDMQLDFLMDELITDYSSVWYKILNATTVREASDEFMLKYEKPKNVSDENQQRRAELGQRFFDEFAKNDQSGNERDLYKEVDELKLKIAEIEKQVRSLFNLV